MKANITKIIKPIDNPNHISLLLPTRKRHTQLKKLFDSIEENTQDKKLIDVWVYVDEDDELTKLFIHNNTWIKYNFKINWIIGERLPGRSGQILNELWKKCKTNAGIYMGISDDYIFIKKHWDELVRQAFNSYPDRILLAYPEDPTAGGEQVTFAIMSAEWLNIVGRFVPEYFPFWFGDTWIDQVAKLIQRKVKLDMRMEPQGGKGKTQGMKNLVFWQNFFNNMLDERINEADALRRSIYPPDSTEYHKSSQKVQVLIQQFIAQAKSIKDTDLMVMEENYALKSSKDPIKDAAYFICETNALNILFKKFNSLCIQNRLDEALDVLRNISQASLLKYNEIDCMRTIVLNRLKDNEKIPPEIVKNDGFYEAIKKIASSEDIKTILEIGSSSGEGSTKAF
ncbi:MAG: hypothetical protein HQK76_17795, partial [Desulfobacterales bacterium]|nr:hypothetical protein [Desulfobacterales bacterium]